MKNLLIVFLFANLLSLLFILPAAADPTTPSEAPSNTEKDQGKFYGWIQQGYTANFANPPDHINYGVNFNWLANGYRLNQVYFVREKVLEQTDKGNIGYRFDWMAGNDAPFLVANGLFSSFTGFDPTSGFGSNGSGSFRQMNAIGIDLPQAYLDIHVPEFLSKRGVDFRVGKFYTLMGREVYPGKDTDFYSRTYENIVATPFTHTGFLATYHASEDLDVIAGVVEGWDVFRDNNNSVSLHGAFIWNSSDSRSNWTTAWITGPEQPHNNVNARSLVSSYLTTKIGKRDRWTFVFGGHYGQDAKAAVDPVSGNLTDARWYGLSTDLFYDAASNLRYGFRAEWFRDNGGTRTGFFGRPGYTASLYDVTFGITYKPVSNVRLRPELRFDWSPNARPFNNQTASSQFTPAVDMIWEF